MSLTKDQVQHIELTRDIARRFNNRFGEVFPYCEALLSEAPRIMGLDAANKMSKSIGNHIPLNLDPKEVERKVTRESVSDTRRVRKTRWRPSSGNLSHFFDDDAVPGTVGLHHTLLRKVEPFPTLTELKPYDPAYIRGWTVERYQIDLRQAAKTSKNQMENTIRQLCARDVPGDTHRNLQVNSRYQGRTFKHILVPVWLVSYTYGRKSYQVVVNGFTGKMAGEHPKSWVKITLAILAAFLVILAVLYLSNQ